jgi:PilZ domain
LQFGTPFAVSDSAHRLDVAAGARNIDGTLVPKSVVTKASMPEAPKTEYDEQRRSRRAKIARPLRVRPSEPRDEHFEDLPISVNASREGVYFTTRRETYYPGMRVFVTFPYSSPHDPMNCEYVAQVVRVEKLPNGKLGVAVHLLMTMNYSASSPSGSRAPA